jgi:exosome complex exonuclease RRP6
MFFYARADTHFLLYIYDMLRNELVEKSNAEVPEENLIEQVLQRSKETSLLRFERQVYNAETGKGQGGWFSLIYKTPSLLNSEQFSVFKAVHQWRDQIARKDDDSINFVMPNSVILSLAKLMPMDMMALLNIVRPISHSVKSRIEDLLQLIKTAKARGKDGPKSIDILKPDTTGAIARAAKASSPSKIDVTPVDSTELTTETSSFWGGAFGSSIWDPTPAAPESDGMRLAIPLPQLSEEVFAPSSALLTDRSRQALTPSQPTPTATPITPIDEPFILKRGAKRKSEVISEPEAEPETPSGEYDISLHDSAEEHEKAAAKAAKRARRAERKAKKMLKKEQNSTAEEDEEEEEEQEEEEDFDYSKAESVLHAKREKPDKKGGRGKKPFDPYAKSMDAGKGMRRVQTERAGRSATFRK